MIGAPFCVWLFFTLFNFGNIDQLFALLATTGLVIIFVNVNKIRGLKILLLDIFCFLLLASPVIDRLAQVPVRLFNYKAFIVPAALFVLLYCTSLFFGFVQYLQIKKAV